MNRGLSQELIDKFAIFFMPGPFKMWTPHKCPDSKWLLFIRIKMVGLSDSRSHSNPDHLQPNHLSKSKQARLVDSHYNPVFRWLLKKTVLSSRFFLSKNQKYTTKLKVQKWDCIRGFWVFDSKKLLEAVTDEQLWQKIYYVKFCLCVSSDLDSCDDTAVYDCCRSRHPF